MPRSFVILRIEFKAITQMTIWWEVFLLDEMLPFQCHIFREIAAISNKIKQSFTRKIVFRKMVQSRYNVNRKF